MERLMHWVFTRDVNILSMINRQLQCKLLDWIMPKVTHLGGATFSITLFVILLIPEGSRLLAVQGLLSLTISHLIVRIIKKNYRRKRPYLSMPETRTFPNPLYDYSFPSGHTTASFSIAVLFALHSSLLAVCLIPLAMLIGVSRIYLGLHYPTDCLIGACLGSLSSFIIMFTFYII